MFNIWVLHWHLIAEWGGRKTDREKPPVWENGNMEKEQLLLSGNWRLYVIVLENEEFIGAEEEGLNIWECERMRHMCPMTRETRSQIWEISEWWYSERYKDGLLTVFSRPPYVLCRIQVIFRVRKEEESD